MKKQKDLKFPFRCGTVKRPSQKRIQKTACRKMESFHVIPAYLKLFPHWHTITVLFKFLHIVIWKFFMLQYLQKIHLTHRPIKHVDHELDSKVPFIPQKIKI